MSDVVCAPRRQAARAFAFVYELYDCEAGAVKLLNITGTEARANARRTLGFPFASCDTDMPMSIHSFVGTTIFEESISHVALLILINVM